MSGSLKRLRDSVLAPDFGEKDPQQFDWLNHVDRLLQGADEMVKVLYEGDSIVTHCSDGWDRTAQLCALVQLCLDPFFRTLPGFALLIDKEWLSFGHQFGKRIGCGEQIEEGYWDSLVGEKGPIFLQFIDCVYQLYLQVRALSFRLFDRVLTSCCCHHSIPQPSPSTTTFCASFCSTCTRAALAHSCSTRTKNDGTWISSAARVQYGTSPRKLAGGC